MFWGGAVFTTGWALRTISSYYPAHKNLFIAQTVFVLAAPPIYSAAEYNILGRLMHYLPMHAPLNPSRLVYFFIYVGAAVESLTAVGGVQLASAGDDQKKLKSGATFLAVSVVLQGAVECLFIYIVSLMHRRCARAKMLTPNVRNICIMLYGTSTLVLVRCIYRSVEKFTLLSLISSQSCTAACGNVLKKEWFLYVFDAAPMILYTYWLNIVHPGKYLPKDAKRFLDTSKVERHGPGWIDKRSTLATFIDLFDIVGILKGRPGHERFWLHPEEWSVTVDGSFAHGTASNVEGRQYQEVAKIPMLGTAPERTSNDERGQQHQDESRMPMLGANNV